MHSAKNVETDAWVEVDLHDLFRIHLSALSTSSDRLVTTPSYENFLVQTGVGGRTVRVSSCEIFVVLRGGTPAAYSLVDGSEVIHLMVHSDYQGLGLGSVLMSYLQATHSFLVLVSKASAKSFYLRKGFQFLPGSDLVATWTQEPEPTPARLTWTSSSELLSK